MRHLGHDRNRCVRAKYTYVDYMRSLGHMYDISVENCALDPSIKMPPTQDENCDLNRNDHTAFDSTITKLMFMWVHIIALSDNKQLPKTFFTTLYEGRYINSVHGFVLNFLPYIAARWFSGFPEVVQNWDQDDKCRLISEEQYVLKKLWSEIGKSGFQATAKELCIGFTPVVDLNVFNQVMANFDSISTRPAHDFRVGNFCLRFGVTDDSVSV